jgi:signal transduction histidine kinase
VEEIIERSQAAAASLFEQKGLTLIMDVEKDLPAVTGDLDRFIQVMLNLISNAVKFTPQGSVTCAARKINNEVVLSVTDSGIGIAKEDHPKVFEKFKQVGDTLTDKPSGTGLGLPICKEIVEHYGGRVWVESEPGKGSTFSFTIPFEQAEADTGIENMGMNALVQRLRDHVATPPIGKKPSEKTVLIVDDDASIRELLRQ